MATLRAIAGTCSVTLIHPSEEELLVYGRLLKGRPPRLRKLPNPNLAKPKARKPAKKVRKKEYEAHIHKIRIGKDTVSEITQVKVGSRVVETSRTDSRAMPPSRGPRTTGARCAAPHVAS